MGKWNSRTLKTSLKGIVKRMKRQVQGNGRKYLEIISDKGLVPRAL